MSKSLRRIESYDYGPDPDPEPHTDIADMRILGGEPPDACRHDYNDPDLCRSGSSREIAGWTGRAEDY